MGGKAPKPELPAARVTWEQAQAYAVRLTERSDGRDRYRLPTEAEWEYACRAGAATESLLSSSDEVKVAWFEKTTEQKIEPQPVGQLAANAFGLYDMLGNVWEWVQDSYVADGYTRHTLYDPLVESPGADRVIRGGSYRSEAVLVRCAKRAFYAPADTLGTIGFRLVRVPQEP
jgi:formylglycine-generating enzyme required for sulfatase activity